MSCVIPQVRVVGATLAPSGLLGAVYVAVAQPGNASLLQVLERRDDAADAAPREVRVVTLLRGVAPSALAAHSSYVYFTVGVARAVRLSPASSIPSDPSLPFSSHPSCMAKEEQRYAK